MTPDLAAYADGRLLCVDGGFAAAVGALPRGGHRAEA